MLDRTRNKTDGVFVSKWHFTDPWIGYFGVASSQHNVVDKAESVAWHKFHEMLRKFAETARVLFEKPVH